MTSTWQAFLLERHAFFDGGTVRHFGDAASELLAARDDGIIAPLDHLGLIACKGNDAQSFLHGQLTNDVEHLEPEQSQYAGYCSAKGRLLANFLVWRQGDIYWLQLARTLLPAIQQRLTRFVLRAKVNLAQASESHAAIGLAGSGAAAALGELFGALPQQAHALVRHPSHGSLIALPGERFQLVANLDAAIRLWDRLAAVLRPIGASGWEWLEICNGLPWITPATQEQFAPQMANLDLLGAVSFQKGCYPGQEIVARTRYLGEIKRRMALAHVDAGTTPEPGDALYSAELEGQSSGMVVNAQPAPGGGCDLLAVIPTSSLRSGGVHLGSADGPRLQIRPLPYALA